MRRARQIIRPESVVQLIVGYLGQQDRIFLSILTVPGNIDSVSADGRLDYTVLVQTTSDLFKDETLAKQSYSNPPPIVAQVFGIWYYS